MSKKIAIPFPAAKSAEIATKSTEAKALFPVLVPLTTEESKRLQTIADKLGKLFNGQGNRTKKTVAAAK